MTNFNLYRNYAGTLSGELSVLLSSIAAEYGFDYGNDFEQILAEAIRKILPQNFGVCRGFVMNENGDTEGDDIIIYDINRFPTLKMRKSNCFSRKEYIPIEAVYAYVEAKHTIVLEGDSGTSLNKAMSQVSKVKSLCNQRKPRALQSIDPYINIDKSLNLTPTQNWPTVWNPPFGAIIANQVRFKKNGKIIKDPTDISEKIRSLSKNGIIINRTPAT